MASSRGILLTLLQISLVASFPHRSHHNSHHHERPKSGSHKPLQFEALEVSPVNSYPINTSPAPVIATTSPGNAPTVSVPIFPIPSSTSVMVTDATTSELSSATSSPIQVSTTSDSFSSSVSPTTSSNVLSSSDLTTYTSTSSSLTVSSSTSIKTSEPATSPLVSNSMSSSTQQQTVSSSPIILSTSTSTPSSSPALSLQTRSRGPPATVGTPGTLTDTFSYSSTTSCETDSTGWPTTLQSSSLVSTSSTLTSSTSTSLTSTSSISTSPTSTSSMSTSLTSRSSTSTSPTFTSSSSSSSHFKPSAIFPTSESFTTLTDTWGLTTATSKRSKSTTTTSLTTSISTSTTVTISSETEISVIQTTRTARRERPSKPAIQSNPLTSLRKHLANQPQTSTVIETSTVSTHLTSTESVTVTSWSNTNSITTPPALAHTFTSIPPVTLETTLTISDVQTLTETTTVAPSTSGIIHTSLVLSHHDTEMPFRTTVIATPTHKVKPITRGPNRIKTTSIPTQRVHMSKNIFKPIATHAPPRNIPFNPNNPVPRLGIQKHGPIETNKFYFNFFSGNQTSPTWTHPYSVAWVKGGGVTGSWGISAVQVPENQKVFGPGDPPSYFVNPIGLQPMILSARELGGSTTLTMDRIKGFSCHVNLSPAPGADPAITFPLVQGMGFVTAVYRGSTPMIQSSTFFTKLVYGGKIDNGIARYTVTLTDGQRWLMYLTDHDGGGVPTLTLASSGQIIASAGFHGSVQIGKVAGGHSLKQMKRIYDHAAGVYPKKGHIHASVEKSQGSYTLSWTKGGRKDKKLLMWALPHHLASFPKHFQKHVKHVKMQTTTKGKATAVHADEWHLHHDNLPTDMGFAPWTPKGGPHRHLSETARSLIQSVAASELAEDFDAQTDLDSMYYSGKGLAKFAFAIYATNDMAKAPGLASAGLMKLKNSFARFVNNEQIFPLYYDSAWGGVVSSCTYTTGDTGCDFGNSIYNDHHFHYGYFVYTAAVIAYLDPHWLKEGDNKKWVNTLVRDYANPIEDDPYFPFQRNFDWFHGHSWAHGLYEAADGKDQESSSEDTLSLYAIKLWGRVTGDENMEARGNLLLGVQARSLHHYYLLQNDNKVEPANYIANKAAGIIFENKIDHTTYFGTNIEFIEGIHMIPVGPASALTRKHAFVKQEWDTYFSDGRVDATVGGWRGIIYAQYAIVDPVLSWNFFAQPAFDPAWLDSGASRTWYLAYAAGLGGAPP